MARTLISPRLLPLAAVAAALVISTSATASPSSSCTVRGSDRSETLTGTAGRDVICGKGGNDRLRGLGGDDVLLGGDGNDLVDGGTGNDSLQGEKGHDVAEGGAGDDSVSGGDGHDLLGGGSGKDVLDGGSGEDAFFAGADDDAVKALDGRRDLLISCGGGKDSLSADGKDPKARDCEGGTPPPAPKADLSVTLTDNVDPVVEGDPVEYRFRVDNAGPNTATGVTVATTVPADATVAAASGCSQAGSVVTCSVGDVASGASAAGVLTVRHGSPGPKSVTSVVDSPVEDPNAANDSATQTTTVEPEPVPAGADLSVSVSAPATASSFTNVDYATTVTNAGPAAADGVSLVFDIDESWSAINRPSGCTQSMFPTTKVTCALGTLAAGDSVSRLLGVSWGEAGDQTVRATVSGASPVDPAAANNSETETTAVSD